VRSPHRVCRDYLFQARFMPRPMRLGPHLRPLRPISGHLISKEKMGGQGAKAHSNTLSADLRIVLVFIARVITSAACV
jgi:hypothetical protein